MNNELDFGREQVERELREGSARLNLALEAARLGDWSWDATSDAVTLSNRAAEIFGILPGTDTTWTQLRELLHEDDREAARLAVERSIAERSDYDIEYRVIHPDGRQVWVSARGRALYDEQSGEVRGMLGVVLDVTHRKKNEAEREILLINERTARAEAESAKERAANILESVTEAFYALDSQWRFTYLNPQSEPLLQRSAKELLGKNVWEEFPDAVKLPFYEEYHLVVREKQPRKFVVFYPPLDTWFEVNAYPAKDGVSVYFRNVTRRIETEKSLQEKSEALQIINELGQRLSAELDLHKLLQAATDAATEISGAQFGAFFYNVLNDDGGSYMLYTISGVPRKAFENFPMPRNTAVFSPTFKGEGVVRVADIRQDPRFGKNAPYYGMPAGHLPVVSYLAVPVLSRSGEVLGGLFFGHEKAGVFSEQAERIIVGLAGQIAIAVDNARLYESAQKARQAAETANRLKDEFLATVSHELRTPLNSILGWATMLRTGQLSEQQRDRAIHVIERSAKSQQQIIEDILDVSRIITGKLRLSVEACDLAHIIEAAVDSVRPSADAKGVKLHVLLDSEANLVMGDAHRLQQIVWNLLSNAVKFTNKGGRVQITLQRVNSQAEIGVADTGKGIRKEFLPHVFDRFSQADSSTTRIHGGLGLGLAIVRHLVELHGGMVMADSPGEEQGATFIVRLPLAVARSNKEAPENYTNGNIVSPAPESAAADFLAKLSDVKVLCVDDEADARDLLVTVLGQSGASVKAAASSPEALDIIKVWKPDVIVSDIGMPLEDGYSLIGKLRSLPGDESKIPAAALTAYARSEDRIRALNSGFQTYVSKPVNPTELVAVVATLAGRTGKSG